ADRRAGSAAEGKARGRAAGRLCHARAGGSQRRPGGERMIWLALALGVGLAAFGATAAAALVAVRRAALARAVARRRRRTPPSFAWLAQAEGELAAASATTSLGFVIFGAALPALVSRGAVWSLAALAVVAMPLALASGYVLPRWLTLPRAETVAARIGP